MCRGNVEPIFGTWLIHRRDICSCIYSASTHCTMPHTDQCLVDFRFCTDSDFVGVEVYVCVCMCVCVCVCVCVVCMSINVPWQCWIDFRRFLFLYRLCFGECVWDRLCVRYVHVYERAVAVLNWCSCRLCMHETRLMHTCFDSLIQATFMHSFIRVPWLIHICTMTHSYTCHDSFIHVTWLWLLHTCDMTHSYMWHDSIIRHRLIYTCDMTHSYMWHDSFIHVTWLIHTCNMTQLSDMDPFIYVTSLMHTFDKTHSYTWHDSLIHVTWLIHTCDMTHAYMWHDSFMHVTRLTYTCDTTDSYTWHDLFIHVTWLIFARAYIHMTWLTHTSLLQTIMKRDSTQALCATWLTHTRDMTHLYIWHDSIIHVTCLTHTSLLQTMAKRDSDVTGLIHIVT